MFILFSVLVLDNVVILAIFCTCEFCMRNAWKVLVYVVTFVVTGCFWLTATIILCFTTAFDAVVYFNKTIRDQDAEFFMDSLPFPHALPRVLHLPFPPIFSYQLFPSSLEISTKFPPTNFLSTSWPCTSKTKYKPRI